MKIKINNPFRSDVFEFGLAVYNKSMIGCKYMITIGLIFIAIDIMIGKDDCDYDASESSKILKMELQMLDDLDRNVGKLK